VARHLLTGDGLPGDELRDFRFDRQRLGALAESNREAYSAAQPFPHIVMDDFVPDEVLDEVVAEFPAPREAQWRAFDNPRERKLASNDDSAMGEATRHLLTELNSAPFVDFLQRLTDIEGLVPDPHLVGGGLHQIERGGHLNVHADFNRHPATGLERRLNVLLYLNRDWRHEYGGALELWSRDMSACEARILPLFNRCLVFSTTSTSFHGHPEPVTCPEGETRKSIALYYYSRDRPPDEGREAHDTLFQARPGEQVPETLAGRASTLGARFKGAARQLLPPIVLTALRRMRAGRR
jgi:Rps23 Pro-64 3,4-dihydroxylase Tpa1-like proline 4-hydroxylase